jgi:branched-chain amino acid transport system ATP-binding protein
MAKELLVVDKLTKRFGGLIADDKIDLKLNEGEILGLIGPNGAGKTTLFNCIAGYCSNEEGSVFFREKNITNLPPEEVCKIGIARTFQLVKVFNGMTAMENVMTAAFLHTANAAKARKRAQEVLDFVRLSNKKNFLTSTLTLPDKKRLEFARALASDPKIIMLDEAMAGLTTGEVKEAVEMISQVRKMGISFIVVEHIMEVIMPISDRVIVLDHGAKIAEDTPEAVAKDSRVIEAYLGKKYVAKRREYFGQV